VTHTCLSFLTQRLIVCTLYPVHIPVSFTPMQTATIVTDVKILVTEVVSIRKKDSFIGLSTWSTEVAMTEVSV